MSENPYYIPPSRSTLGQSLVGLGKIAGDNRRRKKVQQGFMDAFKSNDPNKVAEFVAKNPESAKLIDSIMNFKDKKSKDNWKGTMRDILANPEPQAMQESMVNRLKYLESVGADTTETEQGLQLLGTDPEAFLKNTEMGFAAADEEGYEALKELRGDGDSDMPATVQEWNFYNKLSKDDQVRFLEMKRQSNQIIDIAGVPTLASKVQGQGMTPLSTLEAEEQGLSAIAQAKEQAVGDVKGKQQRLNTLRTNKAGRRASIFKGEKFLKLLENKKLSSGAGRKTASYIPGVYTRQGRLDEEFNAFSERAARQALKADGEIRPTDADVEGMKRAMFGIGRDEKVNIELLKDYIQQQKSDEQDFIDLLGGTLPQPAQPQAQQQTQQLPPTNQNGWQLMTDANGNKAYVSPDGKQFEEAQ